MPIFRARQRPPEEGTAVVESWGVDRLGAGWVENVMNRSLALLQGFGPHIGYGESGAIENTDQSVWASPQAFNGAGGVVALGTLAMSNGRPIVFPGEATDTGIVLPGPGGV